VAKAKAKQQSQEQSAARENLGAAAVAAMHAVFP
jgi:hypothetical protein